MSNPVARRAPARVSPKQLQVRSALPYLPTPGSDAWAVLAFFCANPDEELESADITLKFNVPTKHVHARLAAAVKAEYLASSVRPRPGKWPGSVYSAGPKLPLVRDAMAALVAPQT